MPPHESLTHLKDYDIKNSNVELTGTSIDHSVKYNSALTEPAWTSQPIGSQPGLYIWRIEDFQIVPWPRERFGQFYNGDSYIVLHSYEIGAGGHKKLAHDLFFWLGSKTSQDEAGTAAYKTVELDEFLKGAAVQHREVQEAPSEEFMALFPRVKILSGGVESGFRHVEEPKKEEIKTLLRIFKLENGRKESTVVHEVEPSWESLDDGDVFVLDMGTKIWVWQGRKCSPMEKAKAAQVVNDLTIAKHVDVEVLSQAESRSAVIVDLLSGRGIDHQDFHCPRPMSSSSTSLSGATRPVRLFRFSDASGQLSFDLVKDGDPIQKADLRSDDVFVLDTGKAVWVWRGEGASKAEKAMWIKIAQMYVNQLQNAHFIPIRSVVEGNENPGFLRALEV
jgi:gelsolin